MNTLNNYELTTGKTDRRKIASRCQSRFQLVFCSLLFASSAFVRMTSAAPSDSAAAPVQQFPGRYVLASLVLPGAGELLKGSRVKGEVFLWTDAAVWLTYGSLSVVGNARNASAKLFARRYAGASTTVGSDEYYVNLERYDNSEEYNEDVRRTARELYGDSQPEKQRQYTESHSYTGALTWDWGSDSLRYAYWHQRRHARSALHAAGFVLGAALINRIISAVDVAFFTNDYGQAQYHSPSSTLAARLECVPVFDRPGLVVNYRF